MNLINTLTACSVTARPPHWNRYRSGRKQWLFSRSGGTTGTSPVLTLEMFQVDGALLANEIAPRVHNSGHWTIEGAQTSQFENHIRAVLGWPLGSTEARGVSSST